jgi:hypothetical protein
MRPALLMLLLAPTGARSHELECNDVNVVSLTRNFAQRVCCLQLGETCGEYFPTTCRSPACARVILQVGAACLPWMRNDSVWAPKASALTRDLDAAVTMCAETPRPAEVALYMTNYTNSVDMQLGSPGTAIYDGFAENIGGDYIDYRHVLRVSATAPLWTRLQLQTLCLGGRDDSVFIYDGNDTEAPLVARYLGCGVNSAVANSSIVNSTVIGTGSTLTIKLVFDTAYSEPVEFSLLADSYCSSNSDCGTHGSCGGAGRCECRDQYQGPACSDSQCVGVDCGHGSCADASCNCEPGWDGKSCARATGCDTSPSCGHGR